MPDKNEPTIARSFLSSRPALPTRRCFLRGLGLAALGLYGGSFIAKETNPVSTTSNALSGANHSNSALPTLYIAHGAGPCFFVDMGMGDTFDGMGQWLKQIGNTLPQKPKAILVISAHWEEPEVTINTASNPGLLYDYYGFPEAAYSLKYDAPGSPQLAQRVEQLLADAKIKSCNNSERGLDHGVFIPLKLTYPAADIPIVQLSLKSGLDPAFHLQLGEALAPLRNEGVLIIGSGMSYHNLRHFNKDGAKPSQMFDAWLQSTACHSRPTERWGLLTQWEAAPAAREAHPREEHLIPLMVAAGAAKSEPGTLIYSERIMGMAISGYQFG